MKKGTDYSVMSLEERMALVEKIHVPYPRQTRVMDKIRYCHEHSKISAEPECLFVKGPSGIGKTTMIRKYLEQHPRTTAESGTIIPVLSAIIPVPATVMNLASTLLRNIGDPMSDRGTINNKTERIYRLVRSCGVELIILDEFQHFIDRDSQVVLKTVSDWLKNLINELNVPIILIGMPTSDQILDANEQLHRRFSEKLDFEPFGWQTPEQQKDFRAFLLSVDRLLPLGEFSNLADSDLAYRLYYASSGIVNNVMKIIRRATVLALQRSVDSLTLELLAEAFDEKFKDQCEKNPFRAEVENLVLDERQARVMELTGANRRSRGRKHRERASDVLTQRRAG